MAAKIAGLVWLSVTLVACGLLSLNADRPTAEPVCRTDKIAFTQATGCQNDGSYEFCIPADDPAALAAVQAIVSDVDCFSGSRGRAQCDLEAQVLCMVETRVMCTTEDALTDAGWRTTCRLAALPFIKAIVPTWYE